MCGRRGEANEDVGDDDGVSCGGGELVMVLVSGI